MIEKFRLMGRLLYSFALFLLLSRFAYGDAVITGMVTAKREGTVKVEFTTHDSAEPQRGDQVDFKKTIQGIEVIGGNGYVTETGEGFVWVKTSKGRPNLKMTGLIQATGKAGISSSLNRIYGNLKQKKDGASFRVLERHADKGNAEAQFYVATAYLNGWGVKQNFTKGQMWCLKSAEQAYAEAQYTMALLYRHGKGVKPDSAKAVQWYQKSALQGYALAQANLGWMFQNGNGTKQNLKKAVHWYRKSAEQGQVVAQTNLGWMYENGKGVSRNRKEAMRWYRKAAAQNDADAKKALVSMGAK